MRVIANRIKGLPAIKGDLMGGLMAAVVALPLALAFGVASGLGAQAGLYGAIACGIFASLFGGTPGQVSGPTGPMTVVAAGIIATHTNQPELVFGAIILGGVLQILIGAIKGGQLVHYIPYPVVSGFMSGIGFIIILVEIPPLFGLDTPSSAVAGLQSLVRIPGLMIPEALGIGLLTLTLIYLLPRFIKVVPSSLIALIVCSALAMVLGMEIPRIEDIGQIPQGIPMPVLPAISLSDLAIIVPAGISLALLGSIDSLLTSVIVDKITFKRHDSDKELTGQGIGNIVAGLFGGLPGAGATMRSVVNVRNGGQTGLSGVVHGILLLGVLLGAGSIASQIPLACLAGILIATGISIIDYRGLKTVFRAPKDDVLVMLLVLGLTVFLDLIIAVLAGLSLAAFLFCKRFADLEASHHDHLDSLEHLKDIIKQIPEALVRNIYIYTFNSPLFFGEAQNFNLLVSNLSNVKILILDFRNVPMIDQTGLFTLEDSIGILQRKGIRLMLVGLSDELHRKLDKMHLFDKVPAKNCFDSLESALSSFALTEASSQPEFHR